MFLFNVALNLCMFLHMQNPLVGHLTGLLTCGHKEQVYLKLSASWELRDTPLQEVAPRSKHTSTEFPAMCYGHVLLLKTKMLPAPCVPEAKKKRVYLNSRYCAVMRLRHAQVAEPLQFQIASCHVLALFQLDLNMLPYSDGVFAAWGVDSLICT